MTKAPDPTARILDNLDGYTRNGADQAVKKDEGSGNPSNQKSAQWAKNNGCQWGQAALARRDNAM